MKLSHLRAATRRIAILCLAALALPTFGIDTVGQASTDRDWDPALVAIANKDWDRAVSLLRGVVARDPTNAEVHNRLGYAHRQRNDLEHAFAHYREALRLSPGHLGAHEYIGEAYVIANDLPKAREHLAALERLCGRDCDEYRDLAKAIEQAR